MAFRRHLNIVIEKMSTSVDLSLQTNGTSNEYTLPPKNSKNGCIFFLVCLPSAVVALEPKTNVPLLVY